MIKDQEHHEIELTGLPNPHQLVNGNSGYGKTYYQSHHAVKCA